MVSIFGGSYGTALFLIVEGVWVFKRRNKAKKELERMEADFARADGQGMNG